MEGRSELPGALGAHPASAHPEKHWLAVELSKHGNLLSQGTQLGNPTQAARAAGLGPTVPRSRTTAPAPRAFLTRPAPSFQLLSLRGLKFPSLATVKMSSSHSFTETS